VEGSGGTGRFLQRPAQTRARPRRGRGRRALTCALRGGGMPKATSRTPASPSAGPASAQDRLRLVLRSGLWWQRGSNGLTGNFQASGGFGRWYSAASRPTICVPGGFD
jgi:hypothetical protein